jgi:hypothetical protein
MTEIKTDSVSPYKYTGKILNEDIGLQSKIKMTKSTANFRLKL